MQPAQTLTSPIPLGNALRSRRLPKLAELLAVFIAPAFALLVTGRLAGDDVVIRGVGILIATAMMITAIWFAQRLRGETMAAQSAQSARRLMRRAASRMQALRVRLGAIARAGTMLRSWASAGGRGRGRLRR